MSKKTPREIHRQRQQSSAFGIDKPGPETTSGLPPIRSDARRWYLIGVFVCVALGGTWLMQALKNIPPDVPRYTCKIIREYPHDPEAFTQGLVLEDGFVWESTGQYGKSAIRKVELESGQIVNEVSLDDRQFGEGLALVGDRLYQLTWKEGICHVYDRQLEKVKEFTYSRQGWGLTWDGNYLIMSDGSSKLHFLDPETFVEERVLTVRLGRNYIDNLNELEYSGGSIYANRLGHRSIYEINPETGQVESIIDLGRLASKHPRENVLNGIAVDRKSKQLIVTGKNWPKIYEIELQLISDRP